MRLDLEKLIRFAVIAEEGSFTAAARVLNVDQPWLSRQIKQLEDQLGFPLFMRTTRRVDLTEEGQVLLEHARDAAELARRVEFAAEGLRRDRRSTIKIGVFKTAYWATSKDDLLCGFGAAAADVAVNLVLQNTPELLTMLKAREVDAVIGTAANSDEDVDALLLYRETPCLIVPQEHPLAERDAIHMRDLRGAVLATGSALLNPANFEQIYGPFRDVGMLLRPVEEGKVAIAYYAGRDRLFMLSYGDSPDPIAELGMVRRDIVGCTARVEIWVYRNRGDDRAMVRKFWSVAKGLAVKALGAC